MLELHDRRVPLLGLIGGCVGFVTALAMQLYTNFDYPLDVGGRPLYPLTAFAVVTFELTVLFAAVFTVVGMLAMNGLPRLSYPVFAGRRFHLASRDRFFLCVQAGDPRFDADATRHFLETLGPEFGGAGGRMRRRAAAPGLCSPGRLRPGDGPAAQVHRI